MPPTNSAYQCLSCQLSQLAISSTRRRFTTSAVKRARKSPYQSISAVKLGLAQPKALNPAPVQTTPYTEDEKKMLASKYTAEQMAVLNLGEEAIPADDLISQGLQRTDPMRIAYYDDFSTHRPIIDFPQTQKEEDEVEAMLTRQKVKESPNAKTKDVDADPHMARLSKQTGLSLQELRALHIKILVDHRVVNQTRMGKISSRYYLTVAGDGNGMLGIGQGKAVDQAEARRQAMTAAVRSMRPVPRYEARTIYGDVEAKVGASIVKLFARPPGFGNRAQHLIFEVAKAAGIHDIAARTPRSRNKMNVVKAAYQALMSQRNPEDLARARGRKLIDVRKVYYGGSVH